MWPEAPGRFDPDPGGVSRGQGVVEQGEVLAGLTRPGMTGVGGNVLWAMMVQVQGRGAVRWCAARPVVAHPMPVQGVDGPAQETEPERIQRDKCPAQGHESISLRFKGAAAG